MSAVVVRYARDVARTCVGLLGLFLSVALLVDGVELAGAAARGELGVGELGRRVAAGLPSLGTTVLPVVSALAAALVAVQWRRTGRLVAASACGVSPAQLALAGGAGALAVAMAFGVARELAAPSASSVLAGQSEWVEVHGPFPDGVTPDSALVHADRLSQSEALDVRVAWLSDGRLVGAGSAARARYRDGRWTLDGAEGIAWDDGRLGAVELALPSPEAWSRHGRTVTEHAPLATLWRARDSSARAAFVARRVLTPAAALAFAVLALPLTIRWRRAGVWVVLAAAVAWSLGHGAALAVVARGAWPPWVGVGLSIAVLLPAMVAPWGGASRPIRLSG